MRGRSRRRRGRMGDTWYLHELFVTIQGRQQYLWRAVDEDGDEIDILVQSRRNRRAAIRFFRKVLKGQGREPRRLVTDKLRSYPAAYQTVLPSVVHRRFGCEPLNLHDAHRPLRDDEDLDLIFTWQEERKLSRNLTFQYKRVIYLVAPGPETLPLAGVRCRVHEHDDGRVEVRHAGHALPTGSSSIQVPRVQQRAVVANKRLGAVLSQIRSDQQERDRQRLANRNVTLRQKDRIRAAIARAAASDPRP